MSRDDQRAVVYGAEASLRTFLDYGGQVNLNGVRLQLEAEERFKTLDEVRAYVTRVVSRSDVIEMFGHRGIPSVRERKGDKFAHYSPSRMEIAVNTGGTAWALRELVILHELAHHFSPGAHHGPAFTVAFTELVGMVIGPQAGLAARIIFDKEGVK